MSARYAQSEAMLARALKSIPLGAQTFSKSRTQFPHGVSPYFAARAQGAYVWDVDGHDYVDFINALCAVSLGHNDPDVTAAVSAQLQDGVIFSLSHALEHQVAEQLCAMVPCAQAVRFGKNGSDATSGAIRLARAFTGRDHVAVCGYHGWQDWYIGATARHRGVPQAVRALTHVFGYNDLASLDAVLKAHPGEVAAVILEPMNVTPPAPGFLDGVVERCRRHGALLVLDETITGFRFDNGGAQARFGITPDLACFGKGLANGFPVSAIAGRADVMKLMEEIFFSFTFGGETLSLAAALATMQKLEREPVTATLRRQGEKLIDRVNALIVRYELGGYLHLSGDPSWSFLNFRDAKPYSLWQIKTLYLQEIFARGALSLGTHNLSYAHDDGALDRLLAAYDGAFAVLADALHNRRLEALLRCAPLEPLFKVR